MAQVTHYLVEITFEDGSSVGQVFPAILTTETLRVATRLIHYVGVHCPKYPFGPAYPHSVSTTEKIAKVSITAYRKGSIFTLSPNSLGGGQG